MDDSANKNRDPSIPDLPPDGQAQMLEPIDIHYPYQYQYRPPSASGSDLRQQRQQQQQRTRDSTKDQEQQDDLDTFQPLPVNLPVRRPQPQNEEQIYPFRDDDPILFQRHQQQQQGPPQRKEGEMAAAPQYQFLPLQQHNARPPMGPGGHHIPYHQGQNHPQQPYHFPYYQPHQHHQKASERQDRMPPPPQQQQQQQQLESSGPRGQLAKQQEERESLEPQIDPQPWRPMMPHLPARQGDPDWWESNTGTAEAPGMKESRGLPTQAPLPPSPTHGGPQQQAEHPDHHRRMVPHQPIQMQHRQQPLPPLPRDGTAYPAGIHYQNQAQQHHPQQPHPPHQYYYQPYHHQQQHHPFYPPDSGTAMTNGEVQRDMDPANKIGQQQEPQKMSKWMPSSSSKSPTRVTVATVRTDRKKHEAGVWADSYVLRVHDMLEEAEEKKFTDIISWKSHGRAFKIHQPEKFYDFILPKYFNCKKASFQRWLRAWGFVTLIEGPDRGSYFHRYFVRGLMSLIKTKTRHQMCEAMEKWSDQGNILAFSQQLGDKDAANSQNPQEEASMHEKEEPLDGTLGPKKEDRVLRGKILHEVREMLRMSEIEDFTDIVSWSKNGKTFRIHKRKLFQQQITKKYLSCSKLAYLSDGLRSWGFYRLKQGKGEERNSYFHLLFQKDRPELCRNMTKDQMFESMKDFRGEQKLLEETNWSLLVPDAEILDDEGSNDGSEVHDGAADSAGVGIERQTDSVGRDLGVVAEQVHQNHREEESSTPLPFLSQGPNSIDPIHCLGTNPAIQEAGYFFDATYPSGENAAGSLSAQASQNEEQVTTDGPGIGAAFPGVKRTYLWSLHKMLEESESKGFATVVSWQPPHGRSFKVHDKERFENDILPKYFRGKLISFTRGLISWGFLRLTVGKDRGTWYHRLFVRGATDLVKDFSCQEMANAMKDWIAPGKEPDFQACGSGDVLSEKLLKKKMGLKSSATNTDGGAKQQDDDSSQKQKQENEPDEGASADMKQNDPKKLRGTMVEDIRELLETARREKSEDVVSWLLHGMAFQVHKREAFVNSLLPRFLKCKSYENFADALRRWGFVRLKKNRDSGALYHRLFRRDKPRLTLHLTRKQMNEAMVDWRSPDGTEPNLYDGIPEDVLQASDQIQALRGKKKPKRKRSPSKGVRKKARSATTSTSKPKTGESVSV